MYTSFIISFYLCTTHVYPRFNNRFYLLPSFFTFHPALHANLLHGHYIHFTFTTANMFNPSCLEAPYLYKTNPFFLAQQLVVLVVVKRIFFTPYCSFVLLSNSCCESSFFCFHSLCTPKHYKINTHNKQNQIVLSLLLIPTPRINQFPHKKITQLLTH